MKRTLFFVSSNQSKIKNEEVYIMENSKLNLLDFGHALGREEMKQLMAGSGSSGGDCFQGGSNEEFCQQTGCQARFSTSGTCVGTDGCTYSNAKPC